MEEYRTKTRPRPPAASERVARRLYPNGITTGMVRSIFSKRIPTLTIENLRSLPESTTPAPSLTTVLCRVGDGEVTVDWVMEEYLKNTRPRSPAALGQVARPWRSLPVIPTPAPSLTTVLCRAGEGETTANWVMVQRLTDQHPRSPAASVQVAQQ